MKRYEKPMMITALIYSMLMAMLGWVTAVRVGMISAVVVACVLGTLFLVAALAGWGTGRYMWMTGAVLGCAFLFPTPYGWWVIVPGVVLFFVMMGLYVYVSVFNQE